MLRELIAAARYFTCSLKQALLFLSQSAHHPSQPPHRYSYPARRPFPASPLHCATTTPSRAAIVNMPKSAAETLPDGRFRGTGYRRPSDIALRRLPRASRRTLRRSAPASPLQAGFHPRLDHRRSNSENTPNMPNIARPDAVVVSEALPMDEQVDLGIAQLLHRANQVRQRTPEPINGPDHCHVEAATNRILQHQIDCGGPSRSFAPDIPSSA